MAKKGKGKKGKKGKKKEKKAKDMTEVTREMFEITVKDLTEKLNNCRKKCTSLEESNTDLSARFSQLSTDLGDVINFLKLRLEQKRDELAELAERLEGLDAQRTREQEEGHDIRGRLESDMKKMQTELSSEVQMLSSKLNSLEEFRRMREKLFDEKAALQQRLEQQRVDAEERVYQADRQRIIDSDQLKRDCVRNITNVANAFQETTRRRVNQTTHRTIRENICLTSQMALIADRATTLDARNAALRAKNIENDRVLSALEWTEQSLVSATRKHEAKVTQLQERNNALVELATEWAGDRERGEQQRRRIDCLELRLADQQLLLEAAAAQQREHQLLVERLDDELQQETAVKQRLQLLVSHAAGVVRRALAQTPASGTGGEPRRGLLDQLLAVLAAGALTEQPMRLRPLPPQPLRQLDGALTSGALGLLPGGDGALRLRSADSLLTELEDAAAATVATAKNAADRR